MEQLRIRGGRKLNGSLSVQGAKNSVLPIMAASLLNRGITIIHNCPKLRDVDVSIRILEYLGCRTQRDGNRVMIDSGGMNRSDIPDKLMREMRSSVVFLGAILARAGRASLSMPGGCELGPRPVDLHLSAIREFGGDVEDSSGQISVKLNRSCDALASRHIAFPISSVGATENAMLLACLTPGTTSITNPAREPEISDLQGFLRKLGIRISGAGTGIITIEGQPEIDSGLVEHRIIPDRIVTATYLSAAASAGGHIELTDVNAEHLEPVIGSLREMGCEIEIKRGGGSIEITRSRPLHAARPISTKPYPGFPTDAQPPLMAACLMAQGTTVFIENIFENRYRHLDEFKRLGADVFTEGKIAIICGVSRLTGAEMQATDLRGGAALVAAALGAEGESNVGILHHIERGYERIDLALKALGADIELVDV
ncbi:MAG: UDP-N-acetylglucosamine 1-carboxyvinyltransferase [Oscillospiraceae bacterium]|nr:UDP-N-acetylglucosamine 1-carboxyvinyltransferase [Oscillospiraceae bacterium]